jgi:hypothetical protein
MSTLSPEAVMAIEMEAIEWDLRRELASRSLTESERVVMDLIIRYSLTCGKQSAFIPTQRDLVALSGLSSGHVSDAVSSLARKGLVVIDKARHLCTIMPDPRGWAFARDRHKSLTQKQRTKHLDKLLTEAALSEQHEIISLAREPDLSEALCDVSLQGARATSEASRMESRCGCSPLERGISTPAPNREQPSHHVPETPVNDGHVPAMRPSASQDGTGNDQELLEAVRELLGPQYDERPRVWRLRSREHPGRLQMALANLKERIRATRLAPIRNRGAWLTDEFFRLVNRGKPGTKRTASGTGQPTAPAQEARA